MQKQNEVLIVGGGLIGNVMAINLAQKGYPVKIYERYQDARVKKLPTGRSVSMGLSDRGMFGLEMVNVKEKLLQEAVPMYGKIIHHVNGTSTIVPNGKNNEIKYSIKRESIHIALMNQVDKYQNVKVKFNQKCVDVNLQNSTVKFMNQISNEETEVKSKVILGCDGHFSKVRLAMKNKSTDLNLTQNFVQNGYKELTIVADQNGKHQLQPNYLHLWNRQKFSMTTFPNIDGTFTCTFYMDKTGEESFETLVDEKSILKFFGKYFKELIPLMPNLVQDFLSHPLCSMGYVKCSPWNYQNKVCLIGDSAHAMLPSLGLSLNCGLQDCVYFDRFVDEYKGDWEKIFNVFWKTRKPNSDACCQLIMNFYNQMRFKQNDPNFILMKKIQFKISAENSNYMTTQTMAAFYPQISLKDSYDIAMYRKQILHRLAQIKNVMEKWENSEVKHLVGLIAGSQNPEEQLLILKL